MPHCIRDFPASVSAELRESHLFLDPGEFDSLPSQWNYVIGCWLACQRTWIRALSLSIALWPLKPANRRPSNTPRGRDWSGPRPESSCGGWTSGWAGTAPGGRGSSARAARSPGIPQAAGGRGRADGAAGPGDCPHPRPAHIKKGVTPTNVSKYLYNMVKSYADKNGLRRNDFEKVVHLMDTDGAFVDDSAVVEDNAADRPQYFDDEIRCRNARGIIQRNAQKSKVMR